MPPQFIIKTRTLAQQLVETLNTFKIMKFADLSMEQLAQLRKEIVLNSLYVSDYRNSLDMPSRLVYDFFDGYMNFLWELEEEKYGEGGDVDMDDFFKEFDTQENLEAWYYMHEEFGDEELWREWVELSEDEQYDYNGFAGFYNSQYGV